MGKKNRKFVDKNSPSCITFNLVSTAHNDPRNQKAIAPSSDDLADVDPYYTVPKDAPLPAASALKRLIPQNAARKGKFKVGIPAVLRETLDPEHFGIHENLPVSQLISLSEEVYGDAEALPESFKKSVVTLVSKEGKTPMEETPLDTLEQEDCYFPLDGYNYEQHLRPINPDNLIPRFRAPPPTAATLTQAAPIPRSKEEAEVLAALQDADGYETLSDDLVTAVLEAGVDEKELLWGHQHCHEEEGGIAVSRTPEEKDAIDQALKEARALYSDTSSDEDINGDESDNCSLYPGVGQGGDDNTDAALRRVLEEEYNEEDIGELEEEDPDNACNVEDFKAVMDNFLTQCQRASALPVRPSPKNPEALDSALAALEKEQQERILKALEKLEIDGSENDDDASANDVYKEWLDVSHDMLKPQEREWDCETILSTRSNLYNHPGKIERPTKRLPASVVHTILKAKTVDRVLGASTCTTASPKDDATTINANRLNVLTRRRENGLSGLQAIPEELSEPNSSVQDDSNTDPNHLTLCHSSKDDEVVSDEDPAESGLIELPAIITKRPKAEDPEEKRARKAAVKAAKRAVRQVKKQNAQVLKEEAKRQAHAAHTQNSNDIRQGIRHFRIA